MEKATEPNVSDAGPESKSSEEQGPDARARRREQVRRAQRYVPTANHGLKDMRDALIMNFFSTHRDRKATYVKALEHEVAKLRARDVTHDEETRDYREIIRRLRDLLLLNNIPIPSDLPHVLLDSPLATIEVLGKTDGPQLLRAHMPAFDAAAPYPFERETSQGSSRLRSTSSGTDSSGMRNFSNPRNTDVAMTGTTRHPFGLDSSQVGIDFVLALEHPCLYHHQLPNSELAGNIGAGHELMVLSPIMSAKGAPALETKGKQQRLPTSSKWSVPAIELEKLLSFSQGLDLDGEVTPIQAWQRIRNHPRFSQMTPTSLETIRESLMCVVQCYGYVKKQ